MTTFGELHTCEQMETMTAAVSAVSQPQSSDKSEPFGLSRDGNFVGQDGFVVPKNFGQFYARYPNYVRRWTTKRLWQARDREAVRDLEQDLLLFLCSLPETSRFREASDDHPNGCSDVIECFNPMRQYGANERRWRSWLNLCLSNRASTIYQRQKKDPVNRRDNLRFGTAKNSADVSVDDEYLHGHSELLQRKSAEQSSAVEKRLLANQFIDFVLEKEPRLYDTVLAISESGTFCEAQEILHVDVVTLSRDRRRIAQLKDALLDGGPIPKQRKPYRKRASRQGLRHLSGVPCDVWRTRST